MKIAIGLALTLQIWLVLTNSAALYIASEQGYNYFRHVDEGLLFVLSLAKIILGPIAVALLFVRRNKGVIFTSILFTVYIIGMILMPVLDQSFKPMAWWHNTRHMGQGPLYSLFYVAIVAAFIWNYLMAPAKTTEKT